MIYRAIITLSRHIPLRLEAPSEAAVEAAIYAILGTDVQQAGMQMKIESLEKLEDKK